MAFVFDRTGGHFRAGLFGAGVVVVNHMTLPTKARPLQVTYSDVAGKER